MYSFGVKNNFQAAIRKLRTILLMFALLAFLTSCSTKFAYNYLDWIIQWYIGDLVTLNEDQRFQLDALVQSSLTWHRKTQIPDYVTTLEQIQQDLKHEISTQTLNQYLLRYRQFATSLMQHVATPGSEMLLSLSASQRTELFNNLETQNQEYLEEYLDKDPKKQHLKRVERMEDRFENWLDDLNAPQLQAIDQWAKALKPIVVLWVDDRRAWQRKLSTLINATNDVETLSKGIELLIATHEQSRRPEYRLAIEHNTTITLDLIQEILKKMDQKQKDHLSGQLASMIRQFKDIQHST